MATTLGTTYSVSAVVTAAAYPSQALWEPVDLGQHLGEVGVELVGRPRCPPIDGLWVLPSDDAGAGVALLLVLVFMAPGTAVLRDGAGAWRQPF